MSLSRRLLGSSPPPDPERYTRVPCEACEGKGWLLSGGQMYVVRGMTPVCGPCDPEGWTVQTPEADVSSVE